MWGIFLYPDSFFIIQKRFYSGFGGVKRVVEAEEREEGNRGVEAGHEHMERGGEGSTLILYEWKMCPPAHLLPLFLNLFLQRYVLSYS